MVTPANAVHSVGVYIRHMQLLFLLATTILVTLPLLMPAHFDFIASIPVNNSVSNSLFTLAGLLGLL